MPLTKTQSLLTLVGADDSYAEFDTIDPGASIHTLAINTDAWIDMGQPEEITVSVEPRDGLNG